MRAFGALVYVTVLWQYRSATYGLMPLLACFAIGDVLHRAASDRGQRLLATTHAAALGLVFLPSEYHLPVVGQYKGAYLVVAAAFFVALAARDARASQPA